MNKYLYTFLSVFCLSFQVLVTSRMHFFYLLLKVFYCEWMYGSAFEISV